MIRDIRVWKHILHFNEPFKIAYEEVTEAEVFFIKLTDDKGNIGYGTGSPDPEVTGETVERAYDAIKGSITQDFFDESIEDLEYYHDKIQDAFEGLPSAQSAVEEALINLWSNRHGMSFYLKYGSIDGSKELMVTIGIKGLEETLQEVKKRVSQGFSILKLKIGLDLASDIERIRKSCSVLPKGLKLALDANHGYSFEEAQKLVDALKGLPISFLEQPIASKDHEGLGKLRNPHIKIIGDEAVVTYEDAYNLLSKDLVDGVNIKLMKCGGPINFIRLYNLAKQHGKEIMIGCMYESNLSITTGLYLALALDLDYVDLDSGHMDFPDDPCKGGAKAEKGKLFFDKQIYFENDNL